ncbi:unnamed protein product [Rodentolepis nana]|uniref:Uncharacterized protein n=1 Tax=Rodentolepis nana TaxID=102285 RepID=A0A3P7SKW3_RODNA|nr:unnamed protein product [Rodentolepis nana]
MLPSSILRLSGQPSRHGLSQGFLQLLHVLLLMLRAQPRYVLLIPRLLPKHHSTPFPNRNSIGMNRYIKLFEWSLKHLLSILRVNMCILSSRSVSLIDNQQFYEVS